MLPSLCSSFESQPARRAPGQVQIWRLLRSGAVLLGALLVVALTPVSAQAAQAEDVRAQLYNVSVDVASRGLADRKVAAGAGLNILLTRLSGLTTLPNSRALSAARRSPDRYYSQFRYVTTNRVDELGQGVTELRLKYSPSAVRRLMTVAELPLWTLNRPRVAIWLAERGAGGTTLIDDPAHPVLGAVLARASYRGLPAVVPGYTGVSANAVWNRDRAALIRASNASDADLQLVGRAEQLGPDNWQVRWTTWTSGQGRNLNLSGDLANVSTRAIDMVVDPQVRRFTVAGGAGSTLELVVERVSAVDDYAQVLKYLGSLGYVEKVDVSSLRADELTLLINTASDADKFASLLKSDGRLLPSTRTNRSSQNLGPISSQPPVESASEPGSSAGTANVIPIPVVAEAVLRMEWQG